MLKVKNNDIYLNRGETGALNFEVWNTDGTPFVLPARSYDGLASVVRRGEHPANKNEDANISYSFITPLLFPKAEDYFRLNLWINHDSGCKIVLRGLRAGGKYFELIKEADPSEVALGTIAVWEVKIDNDYEAIQELVVYNGDIGVVAFYGYDDTGRQVLFEHHAMTWISDLNILALTVKSADNGDIVLSRYMNLSEPIVNNGDIDYSLFGWGKFTTPEILEALDVVSLEAQLKQRLPEVMLGKVGDNYYHLARTFDKAYELRPYSFRLSIPIKHADTTNLYNNEYTYDIIVYHGIPNGWWDAGIFGDTTVFPFAKPHGEIAWKRELIEPHKFIIGDSNNV